MATANNTSGSTTEIDRDQPVTKREDYVAPKLTVVGTVQELTLGTSNVGGPDGFYRTGGGG